MNEKIRNLMREVERRGGKVGFSDSIPDEIAEEFLMQVLDCPDCRDDRETIDRVLGTSRGTVRNH